MDDRFDLVTCREGTGTLKYDFHSRRGIEPGALPYWVADMEFQTPQCVRDALVERSKHGIFGYSYLTDEYFGALENWLLKRHDWKIDPTWVLAPFGVVNGISISLQALTQPGDSVLIFSPVYYPFSEVIEDLDRNLVRYVLLENEGAYSFDPDAVRRLIQDHQVKVLLLCSPHNPVNRVWTKEELLAIANICLDLNVKVVSDEIHMDFVFSPYQHTIFATLSPEVADITITLASASKTFNLAGLTSSHAIISNRNMRKLFKHVMGANGLDLNVMGIVAAQAAYSQGGEWVDALLVYLKDNFDYLEGYLHDNLPGVRLTEPQGTYLAWLDFRCLHLTDSELNKKMQKVAGLWLDPGTMFGPGGEGFQRINIATPRVMLEEACKRMKRLFE
jgi:cystathionine beta-lyase